MKLALGRWRRQRGTLAPAATATRAQAPSASRCQRRGLSRIGSDHPRTLLRSESPSSTAHPSGPERGAGKAKCTPDKLVGPGCHRWAGARMNSTTRAAHSTSLRGCCHHSKHHSPTYAGTPLYAANGGVSSRMLSIRRAHCLFQVQRITRRLLHDRGDSLGRSLLAQDLLDEALAGPLAQPFQGYLLRPVILPKPGE